MKEIAYKLDASANMDYSGPSSARITINAELARRIVEIAKLVSEKNLVKASIWACPEWLEDDESIARTDIDQIVVYDTFFTLTAALKHTDVTVSSNSITIERLCQDFGLPQASGADQVAETFVIRSRSESNGEEAYAYWSSVDGWGGRETATTFSKEETQTNLLPISMLSDAEYAASQPSTEPAEQSSTAVLTQDVAASLANVDSSVIDYIEDQLSNSEDASDEELGELFKEAGLSEQQTKFALGYRSFYLTNIVHKDASPLRGHNPALVFYPSAKDFVLAQA